MLSRSITRGLGVVLIAGAVAVGAAACGDDDDESSSALTEEEFVAQANAICEAGNERVSMAEEQAFTGGTPNQDDLVEFFDTLTSDVQQQIDDVSALEPPEQLQGDVDAFLEEAQSALDTVKAEGPEALFSDSQASEDPFAKARELAADLGLDACASDAEG